MSDEKRSLQGGTDELESVRAYVDAAEHAPHLISQRAFKRYWRDNIRLMAVLLVIWAAVSYGAGILFADALNQIRFFGFGLGFWFAQQGAIYVFVILIGVYAWRMHRLEQRLHIEDDDQNEAG